MFKPNGEEVQTNKCACLFQDDKCIDICCYHMGLEKENAALNKKITELINISAKQHNELLDMKRDKRQ